MSPPPRGSDRDLYAEALDRLSRDLDRAEDKMAAQGREILDLRLAVGALQAERGDLLRRVGELEAWRREESVSKGGLSFRVWGGVVGSAVGLAALVVGLVNLARGCGG